MLAKAIKKVAAATTDAQRSLILTAGQYGNALGQPTPHTVGFLIITVAVLIISVVMLRSKIFNKMTAYVGILACIITFADVIILVIVPSIAGGFLMVINIVL